MLVFAFVDRALDALGIFYLIKGTWMFARGRGFFRAFL